MRLGLREVARHKPAPQPLLQAAASRYPGHLGVEVFRPGRPGGDYRIVYRFASAAHLRTWLDSDEHAAWLERAEPHAAGPIRRQFLTGLESWFTLPAQPGAPPPPPYKMALVPRLAVTTAVTVPLMTWVVMPRVTRLLRSWLYP